MRRFPKTLVVFSLLLTPATLLAADPAPQTPKEQEIVKITLHPMAETHPVLKYQLLPPFLDRKPGNAAVWWNQFLVYNSSSLTELDKPGLREKKEKWMAIPIGDPREKEFRAKEPAIDKLLQNSLFVKFDYAARLESCNWELPLRDWRAFDMALPELNASRSWGRLLVAKAHREIVEKKYGDAVRTFQTGLALARDDAQGQMTVFVLVGTAIAWLITDEIEQFIQQPDAPNLYWSLAMLPRPLIDYRPVYECEMNAVALDFPYLQDVEKKHLSKEQWDELLGKVVADIDRFAAMAGNHGSAHWVVTVASMMQGYPRAQRYLIDRGRTKAEVEAMPQAQVVLLYSMSLYEELRDDQYKAMFLTYPEAKAELERLDAKLREGHRQEIIPLASRLQPHLSEIKLAETRMPWIIARLRIFEALRIYAAAHGGQLPERLGDIREVPIPVNPYDDKPFTYHRDGNRAILSVESGPHGVPWRYEIAMLPKGK